MFKLNKFIETSKTVRLKGWHAEGNSAAKPVLMCDGTQFRSLTIWPHCTTQNLVLDALNDAPVWQYRLRCCISW
jgi:hypothetical protein